MSFTCTASTCTGLPTWLADSVTSFALRRRGSVVHLTNLATMGLVLSVGAIAVLAAGTIMVAATVTVAIARHRREQKMQLVDNTVADEVYGCDLAYVEEGREHFDEAADDTPSDTAQDNAGTQGGSIDVTPLQAENSEDGFIHVDLNDPPDPPVDPVPDSRATSVSFRTFRNAGLEERSAYVKSIMEAISHPFKGPAKDESIKGDHTCSDRDHSGVSSASSSCFSLPCLPDVAHTCHTIILALMQVSQQRSLHTLHVLNPM